MPVRAVLEAMGYTVDWDSSKNAVVIDGNGKNTFRCLFVSIVLMFPKLLGINILHQLSKLDFHDNVLFGRKYRVIVSDVNGIGMDISALRCTFQKVLCLLVMLFDLNFQISVLTLLH